MTGTELKHKREELGLSREQLAEKFQITAAVVEAWENEPIAAPTFPRLLEFAMSGLEYELTRMSDEEYEAVLAKANAVLEGADRTLAQSREAYREARTEIEGLRFEI
jgi:transcriptional regulator with XRE-family HTH domain